MNAAALKHWLVLALAAKPFDVELAVQAARRLAAHAPDAGARLDCERFVRSVRQFETRKLTATDRKRLMSCCERLRIEPSVVAITRR